MEHDEQVALFQWADYQFKVMPELALMYAIPNGGKRHKMVAIKLKREGVKAGVLDIHLPVARGKFIGLWIEMKYGKNKPSKNQSAWIDALRLEGHRVEVCYSAGEAIEVIKDYLKGKIKRFDK